MISANRNHGNCLDVLPPAWLMCPARDVAVSSKFDELRHGSRKQEPNDVCKEDDDRGDNQDPEGSGQEAASGQVAKPANTKTAIPRS